MFTQQGHIELRPKKLFELARSAPRDLVNNFLIAGTPYVFDDYANYRAFLSIVGERLGIHPHAVRVRGSAHLGYSIAPRAEKVWRRCEDDSDIDLAIVDVDYYEKIDNEVQRWESRQGWPHPRKIPGFAKHARRVKYRAFQCVADDTLPPNTCTPHRDALAGIDTVTFCGKKRDVNAFIYRDWWCLRNRYEADLRELVEAVDSKRVTPPPEQWPADDGPPAAAPEVGVSASS